MKLDNTKDIFAELLRAASRDMVTGTLRIRRLVLSGM